MGLFDKNPNEKAYIHGQKHWTDVIKNSGSGELLIWRQPEEDFNTNSTLVVMPGEMALFIKGGIIEQTFDNGTYKLSTENYPFISRLRNAFSGGVSTFNCVVYFVRKSDSREIKWGTESPIQVRDKVFGIRTDVRARGSYKVRIENPALFLEKLIGNNVDFKFQTELNDYFASEFQGKIKTAVSRFLNEYNNELIGLDSYLDELSERIEPYINEILLDYGIKCSKFSLSALDVDKTKYDEIDKSQMAQIAKIRDAQGDKNAMGILGDAWSSQKSYEILHDLANNESGIGGVGFLGTFGSSGTLNSLSEQISKSPDSSSGNDAIEKLTTLKKMFEADLITEEEYNSKKAEILSKM